MREKDSIELGNKTEHEHENLIASSGIRVIACLTHLRCDKKYEAKVLVSLE